MPVYFDRARRRWRYEYDRRIDGCRRRVTKLLPSSWTRAEAEAYAAEHDRRLHLVATGALKPEPLIAQAVLLYLQHRAPHLKNRAKLERDLALIQPWYAGRRLSELPQVCRQYAAEHATVLRPATVRNRLAYLTAACRWAWKHHGLGEHDPAERVTLPPVRNERHRYLTRAEVVQLARTITHPEVRAVVLVAYYSGMRLSECLRARPARGAWHLEDTKNGDRRSVPIHPKVAQYARRWPRACAARTVQSWFQWACEQVGLEDVRFHDLRHAAASAMVNAGVPLYTVGAVLGHRAAASTRRYSHLATQTLAEAVKRIG